MGSSVLFYVSYIEEGLINTMTLKSRRMSRVEGLLADLAAIPSDKMDRGGERILLVVWDPVLAISGITQSGVQHSTPTKAPYC